MLTKKMHWLIFNLLTLFMLFVSIPSEGQNSKLKFGEINMDEIKYNKCDFDPDAEAVVFFDCGESKFEDSDDGFNVVYNRFSRIKILKNSGTHWAEVNIPLYASNNIYETVDELKAAAYNLNEFGVLEKTPITLQECKTEKINNNWVQKKFAIPNVKAGTIIEYQYEVRSQYVFNLHDWEFQWKIPVLYSQYEVSMIPFYQYMYSLQGATQFDSYEKSESDNERRFSSIVYKDLKHHFVLTNVPAFNDEEFISSTSDYIIKLEFQLCKIIYPNGLKKDIITTWEAMKQDLQSEKTFGKYQQQSQKLAKKIFDLNTMAQKSQKARFDTVISYVKQNTSWNGEYRLYTTKSPDRLLTDKSGNSAEINLFAAGLLNACGVNCRPVILSTRGHGKIKTGYPFYSYFNNVVLCANPDSTWVVTDATNTEIDNNRIPSSSINGVGLIIDNQKKVEWCNLNSRFPSIERTKVILNVGQEESTASINVTANEYLNQKYRDLYGNYKSNLVKAIRDRNYIVNDSAVTIASIDNKKNYSYKFDAKIKTEKMNGKIYVSPFAHEIFTINPLRQKTRSYPIDMIYPQTYIYESSFEIPKGYKVTYTPQDKEIDNNLFSLSLHSSYNNDLVKTVFSYQFKKPEYESSLYDELKSYFKQIITAGSEKIVLEK